MPFCTSFFQKKKKKATIQQFKSVNLKKRKFQFFSNTIKSTTCWHGSCQTLGNDKSLFISQSRNLERKGALASYLRATLKVWNGFLRIGCNNCNRVWGSDKKTLTKNHISISISWIITTEYVDCDQIEGYVVVQLYKK